MRLQGIDVHILKSDDPEDQYDEYYRRQDDDTCAIIAEPGQPFGIACDDILCHSQPLEVKFIIDGFAVDCSVFLPERIFQSYNCVFCGPENCSHHCFSRDKNAVGMIEVVFFEARTKVVNEDDLEDDLEFNVIYQPEKSEEEAATERFFKMEVGELNPDMYIYSVIRTNLQPFAEFKFCYGSRDNLTAEGWIDPPRSGKNTRSATRARRIASGHPASSPDRSIACDSSSDSDLSGTPCLSRVHRKRRNNDRISLSPRARKKKLANPYSFKEVGMSIQAHDRMSSAASSATEKISRGHAVSPNQSVHSEPSKRVSHLETIRRSSRPNFLGTSENQVSATPHSRLSSLDNKVVGKQDENKFKTHDHQVEGVKQEQEEVDAVIASCNPPMNGDVIDVDAGEVKRDPVFLFLNAIPGKPLGHHAKHFYAANIRTEVDLDILVSFDDEDLTALLRDLKKQDHLAYVMIKRDLKARKVIKRVG